MEALRERIKKIRKALKLNQFEFANKLNVTQAFVSQVETGRHGATKTFLIKISYVFAVRPEYLEDGAPPIFFETDKEKDDFIKSLGADLFNVAITSGQTALNEISKYTMDFGLNFFDRTTSAKELVKWANFFDIICYIIADDQRRGTIYRDVFYVITEALRMWKQDGNEETIYSIK
jgi:transcriptional regulator with XRE-family HTH domain